MIGCNMVDSALEKQAESANKMCPMQVDEITTLERVEYVNKVFSYYYVLEPSETADYIMNEISDDVLKSSILTSFREKGTSELREFKDLCESAECVIVFHYKLEDKQKDITISAYEL